MICPAGVGVGVSAVSASRTSWSRLSRRAALSTKPAFKLRLASNDAEHSHTAAVRRETTKHAIADRLPIFGGVEVLEVETFFKNVVLDIQEARQVSERAPHEHPRQHEMARAGVPEVEVPGRINVEVERVPRVFGRGVHGRASVAAVNRQGEIDNSRGHP